MKPEPPVPAPSPSPGASPVMAGLAMGGVALVAWVGALGRGPLVVASGLILAAGALGWVAFRGSPLRGLRASAFLLAASLAVAWASELHLVHLSRTWEARTQVREQQVRQQLGRELDAILLAGEDAVGRLVAQWAGPEGADVKPHLVRLPRGVDALALFGPGGDLLQWHGEHLGPVPRDVRLGLTPYLFRESALFAYLYVVRPLPDGSGTAMAATLLRADLPASLDDARADVVSRFFQRTGARIEVGGQGRITDPVVWTLTWERDVLFSVAVLPPRESEVREQLVRRWKALVTLLLVVFWVMLASASRRDRYARLWVGGLLLIMAWLLPRGIPGLGPRLFAPADFLLPGAVALTLGQVLLLAASGLLLSAFHTGGEAEGGDARHVPGWAPRWVVSLLALSALLGLPLALRQGASLELLAGSDELWMAFIAAVFLSVVAVWRLILRIPLREAPSAKGGSPVSPWLTLASLLVLGVGGAIWVQVRGPLPDALLLLWAVPLLGLPRAWNRGGVPRLRWLLLLAVAMSAIVPWGWGARLEARMIQGEERIERLGIQPDPFVEYLLIRSGEVAQELSRTGRSPVEVLYGAWTRSGLAGEGIPLWLSWADAAGVVREELQVGVSGTRPPPPRSDPLGTRVDGQVLLQRFAVDPQHYRVEVALPEGATLTMVVPPRLGFEEAAPLGPLFSPARSEANPVSLIPILMGEAQDPGPDADRVVWRRGRGAWIGEATLVLPEQAYRVRYRVPVAPPLLMVARGFLLFLGGALLVGALVLAGQALRRSHGISPRGVPKRIRSFQGKLTLTLFFFFVVPSILFGALAYQTLSAASVRTAETLAARAVEEAAAAMDLAGGRPVSLPSLAAGVGSDLLRYEGGQLVEGSRRELVALGLYPGWVPPAVAQTMREGGEVQVTAVAALGGWDYVVAFQRIAGGAVLAAPAALQAGATAVRQRELAELLAFALVLGGLLSLLLSLWVGRALAQPIQTLQIASERVGAGNLRVRLPEGREDEFGSVFSAFNRMVDQRARAQRALIRGSRRTRAIVAEVATGVVAVDPVGRIVLANPRAEVLLSRDLPRRAGLSEALAAPSRPASPEVDEVAEALQGLAQWVGTFLSGSDEESRAEFILGDRRIRGRVRRIGVGAGREGAVLALEDVTDELRTERILAWGEMAQQVAHEVKNPLTPMKLGIQHIQRAWADEHPDFARILDRNAQAILTEIQRLAQVSSSFASFAAPSAETVTPLEAVQLTRVVNDVLDLYAAGSGSLLFRSMLPEDLVPVLARSDEFKEVLFNVFENARAAMAGEGLVEVLCVAADRDEVHLAIRDDGPGIPAHILPKVFEPHFSTTATGTGLGLAIVSRLVTSWGGRVALESREGKGTEVHLWIRAAGADIPAPTGTGQSAVETQD
jgi:two-component system, NtrC family, nitrogen regulation sensor histidine kinase NtrY